MENMCFNAVDGFKKALDPNAKKIMENLTNFTNIKRIIQLSKEQ
ncbi:hypothetical protein [Polaribacter sp. SA4-10]|nr:hypothetical protein [Polaribacter sp. SA4-10]